MIQKQKLQVDKLALKLARLYYRKDRADAGEVRRLADLHTNPSLLWEDFLEGYRLVT
jgi:hypothetical protein